MTSVPRTVAALAMLAGQVVMGVVPSMVVGGPGWALRFDGEDDYVLLRDHLPEPPFSIDFWAQPLDVVDGNGARIVKYNSKGVVLSKNSFQSGSNLFSILYNGGEIWKEFSEVYDLRSDDLDPTDSAGSLYHYAYTQNATGFFKVYLNGVVIREGQDTKPTTLWDAEALKLAHPWFVGARVQYIGGDWVMNDRCFGGIVDNLRWWSVALDIDEIHRIMPLRLPDSEPGLYRQWAFDRGSGFGDTAESMVLGGGDLSRSPTWVPSPIAAVGGPVVVAARVSSPAQDVSICALISSPAAGAWARASFTTLPSLGDLDSSEVALVEVPDSSSGGSTTAVASSMQLCGIVRFTPDSAGTEQVEFEVLAEANGVSLSARQQLMIRVDQNFPPVAGAAKALQMNGKDEYASLGTWDVPDDFSIGLWVKPTAVVEDAIFLSKHLSKGSNLFQLGHYGGGYWVYFACRRGCGPDSISKTVTFPVGADTDTVLGTGKTVAQVKAERGKAQHFMLTMKCKSRGDMPGSSTSARLTLYADGLAIGIEENFPVCFHTPLMPEDYDPSISTGEHPTPWELGQEYDGGEFNKHMPGTHVTPSNFFAGILDDVIFWGEELSAEEAGQVARGDHVRPEKVIVRYTFDSDDADVCKDRQLADGSVTCHQVNEELGRAVPEERFPWTNSLIGDVKSVPSPFWSVPGSPVYKAMREGPGSCASVTLQASDPDGDQVGFTLVPGQALPGAASIAGAQLEFCSSEKGAKDVTVRFDACDEFGLCASNFSGLGTAVFHILPSGPTISAFQAIPASLELRVVFDAATNAPSLTTAAAVSNLFAFNSSIDVLLGSWEEGDRAVRLLLPQGSWPPPPTTASVRFSGSLRDAAELSYPSTSMSPPLQVVSCPDGQLLLPSEAECSPCPGNAVPVQEAGREFCEACPAGQVASGSSCTMCPLGTYRGTHSGECSLCGQSETTLFLAATAATDCVCEEGSYRPGGAAGGECVACPTGMSCPAGSDMRHYWAAAASAGPCALGTARDGGCSVFPVLKPSFYSASSDPLSVYLCKQSMRCPGGDPGTCQGHGTSASLSGLSCSRCPDSWRWQGSACVACGVVASTGLIAVLGFIGLWVLMACLYWLSVGGNDVPNWSSMWNILASVALLLVQHYQMTSSLSSANVQLEGINKDVIEFWSFLERPAATMQMECLGWQSFSDGLWLRALAPAALLLTGLTMWALSRLATLVARRNLDLHRDVMIKTVLSLIFSLFPAIAAVSMVTFKCHDNPSGRRTLVADEGILCSGGTYETMIVISVLATLCYVGGFGGLFSWAICKTPARYTSVAFRTRWKFLLMKYQEETWWWSLPFLAKTLLLNIGYIILDQGVLQFLWVIMVALVYVIGVVTFRPWRHPAVTWLDVVANGAFVVFCAETLWQSEVWNPEPIDTSFAQMVAAAGVAVNASVLLAGMATGIYVFRASSSLEAEVASKAPDMLGSIQAISVCSDKEFAEFVKRLSAFDRATLHSAIRVINTDFLGKSVSMRCTSSEPRTSGGARPHWRELIV